MKEFIMIAKSKSHVADFEDDNDRNEFMDRFASWTEDLIAKNLFVRSDMVSKCQKVVTDSQTVLDRPLIETKELLSGYFLIRAKDLNHAVEITKSCPVLRFDNLEVYEVFGGTHNG